MSDISAKLESLRSLKGEMKDWKKDDLRKKKGLKDKDNGDESQVQKAEDEHAKGDDESAQGEQKIPEDDVIKKLMLKLMK